MFSLSLLQTNLGLLTDKLNLHFVEQTESTNTDVKRLPSEFLDKPYVLVADHQTDGRGQYDRKWDSENGKNGICSIAYRPKRQRGIALTGLLMAVAIAETSEFLCDISPFVIKWPNDVQINGRKVAGILVETQFRGQKIEKIVIGFGININQKFDQDNLDNTAISLADVTGNECNRELILARVLRNFFQLLELWEENDPSLSGMINRRLIGYEKTCTVKNTQTVKQQIAWVLGVDNYGRLGILNQENENIWFEHEQIRLEPHS